MQHTQDRAAEQINDRLLTFIRRSPTALHAAQNAAESLTAAGYCELWEHQPWQLQPGGRYFVRRNGSAIAAFRLPQQLQNTHFQLYAAHGDSPALRVKTVWRLEDKHYLRLNTETYGGGLWGTWFDRPLSLAGRVTLRTADGGLATRLVDLDSDLLMLPSLPIHFNRQANDGVKLDPQADLCPLLSLDTDLTLEDLLAGQLGVAAGDILSHQLTVYCRSAGRRWGAKGEFLSAPRLDDLACAFAGLEGLLQCAAGHAAIPVWVCFDNEEVGSNTRQGAAGTFLVDTLERIGAALGWDRPTQLAAQAASYMISADNAHALHPAHGELYDSGNRTQMNGGVVLKHAVAYATDGETDGLLRALCQKHSIPLQDFANRSNIRGGSTLANIAATQLNLRMADIGLPQLAMHAAYETAGTQDLAWLVQLATHFFSETLCQPQPGSFYWQD